MGQNDLFTILRPVKPTAEPVDLGSIKISQGVEKILDAIGYLADVSADAQVANGYVALGGIALTEHLGTYSGSNTYRMNVTEALNISLLIDYDAYLDTSNFNPADVGLVYLDANDGDAVKVLHASSVTLTGSVLSLVFDIPVGSYKFSVVSSSVLLPIIGLPAGFVTDSSSYSVNLNYGEYSLASSTATRVTSYVKKGYLVPDSLIDQQLMSVTDIMFGAAKAVTIPGNTFVARGGYYL